MDVMCDVMWKRIDAVQSMERFRLLEMPNGYRFEGTVLIAFDDIPAEINYTIDCSPAWITERVAISMNDRSLLLGRDELPNPDIDLSVTPSTNTLPIRRLDLKVGESKEVTATWVRFPELVIQPLPQRYTRLTETRYRYESRGGAFTAELEVDENGVVIDYPPAWERVIRPV